ncbi:MAG: hypothetical protein ACRDFS_09455 [Chloroflexota bacterium]
MLKFRPEYVLLGEILNGCTSLELDELSVASVDPSRAVILAEISPS